jgi:alpha-ribazole phosphatase/probable phosphoglycerate mutase
VGLDVAYASDLLRTAETATIALRGRNVPLYYSAGLRECNYGEWEGLSADIEGSIDHSAASASIRNPRVGGRSLVPHPNAAPGGETLTLVLTRFLAAVEQIVNKHRGQTILLVSHDGPIRAWFSHILGWDLSRCWEIEIRHCGLSEVHYNDGKPRLVRIDGTVDGRVRDALKL